LGKNMVTLLQHLIADGALRIDLSDEITSAMTLTHDGAVR
jgi:NAD/NADP transhydrogenase alpha subunit